MNQAHADMAEWSENNPTTRRAHLELIEPKGRPEQGWTARRCSPEMACWEPDDDDKEAMKAFETVVLMLVYSASVVFVMWLFLVMVS